MKIALIGYGKMGRAIEEVAVKMGHDIVLKIDIDNTSDLNAVNLKRADAAIEFTGPHSAFENVMHCLQHHIPVVCGSTGWLDKWDEVKTCCERQEGSLVYSSNYSIGVNIFFEVNKRLAELMAAHASYQITMEETHHTEKKTLPAERPYLLRNRSSSGFREKNWVNRTGGRTEELEIISRRIDPTPGTHTVKYSSPIDDIEIIHTAHNRTGFATGAVLAAEFARDKKGIFTMKEVLGM